MRKTKYRNFTILVAEDDTINFIYVTEALKQTKIKLIHAKNGIEAVDICKKNKSINMILMDLRMPQLNGYEATKQIKELYPDLPIIAVTAFLLTETKEMAMEAGCDDYFTKPISQEQLLEIIDKVYNN